MGIAKTEILKFESCIVHQLKSLVAVVLQGFSVFFTDNKGEVAFPEPAHIFHPSMLENDSFTAKQCPHIASHKIVPASDIYRMPAR